MNVLRSKCDVPYSCIRSNKTGVKCIFWSRTTHERLRRSKALGLRALGNEVLKVEGQFWSHECDLGLSENDLGASQSVGTFGRVAGMNLERRATGDLNSKRPTTFVSQSLKLQQLWLDVFLCASGRRSTRPLRAPRTA